MSLLLYCVLNKCHFHWPVALFTDILLWFLCPHILWRKLVSCFFTESHYFARGRRQRCDADCHTNLQFCLHTLSLPQGTVLLYSTLLCEGLEILHLLHRCSNLLSGLYLLPADGWMMQRSSTQPADRHYCLHAAAVYCHQEKRAPCSVPCELLLR